MLKGITVKLINVVDVDRDEFNAPIYEEVEIYVDNVLVQPATAQEIIDSQNLYGRKVVYNIAIPKGDKHEWENQYVEFFGERFHVFTLAVEGIENMIPLEWNKKYQVERYE